MSEWGGSLLCPRRQRAGHRGRRCDSTFGGSHDFPALGAHRGTRNQSSSTCDHEGLLRVRLTHRVGPTSHHHLCRWRGAFGLISRWAMLDGLREVNAAAMPFARLFCGQCSEYLWEDDLDEIHTISQGEGGKQGDAMMLLSHSLGQHRVFEEVARRLTARSTTSLSVSLWRNAGIRIHVGKTQMWNRGGTRPIVCDRREGRSSCQPQRQTDRQGIKVTAPPSSGGRTPNSVVPHPTSEGHPKRLVVVVALRFSACQLPDSFCGSHQLLSLWES